MTGLSPGTSPPPVRIPMRRVTRPMLDTERRAVDVSAPFGPWRRERKLAGGLRAGGVHPVGLLHELFRGLAVERRLHRLAGVVAVASTFSCASFSARRAISSALRPLPSRNRRHASLSRSRVAAHSFMKARDRHDARAWAPSSAPTARADRKSTRLNSSHGS